MWRKLRDWITGHLSVKMLLLMALVLVPLQVGHAVWDAYERGQLLEDLLLKKAKSMASSGATTISYVLEDALTTGRLAPFEVFDTAYQPIPNTNPQKYTTAYDDFLDANTQDLHDIYLQDTDILYAVAVDIKGYLPTHNSRYSQPLTGDYETDLVGNRTKRIFDDPVGLAAAQNIEPVLQQIYFRDTGEIAWDVSVPIRVLGAHWGAYRIGLSSQRVAAQREGLLWQSAITALVEVVVVLSTLALAIRTITRPLASLTEATTRLAAGDFTQTISTNSPDEVGVLARSFNNMAKHLQVSQTEVAERAKALATNLEVSRRLSTVLDPKQLVSEVVQQLQSAFGYYHAHIYLWDEGRQNLVMAGGTGEAGRLMLARGHKLPRGRGLVGRAADGNQTVLVSDTAADPNWLPNPLLPETRAEVAVPIAIGDRVLGVLDVQQNRVGGLTTADAELVQSLANQVAIALQNAQSFERTQRQAERQKTLNAISRKIQSATSVESVLETAARELGLALNAARARAELEVRGGRTAPPTNGEPRGNGHNDTLNPSRGSEAQ